MGQTAHQVSQDTPYPYPTIARLAGPTGTTHGYQGPVLVAEAVACWYELHAKTEALSAAQSEAKALRLEMRGEAILRSKAEQEVAAVEHARDLERRLAEAEAAKLREEVANARSIVAQRQAELIERNNELSLLMTSLASATNAAL